jgi:hypothetical protein
LTQVIDRVKKGFDEVDRVTSEAAVNIELFRPFIFENSYIFRADNIRALRDRMPPEDRAKLVWGPENVDIYDYWMNIHFPGLERWVLPELDETYAARPEAGLQLPRPAGAVRHDVEAARDAARRCASSAAAARRPTATPTCRSWRRAWACSWRCAGVAAGQRVMLFAKNAPEWSMAYFGTLKAGATSCPSHTSRRLPSWSTSRARPKRSAC